MIKGYSLWLLSLFLLPFFQGGYFDQQVFFFGLFQAGVYLWNFKVLGNTILKLKKEYRIGFLLALFVSFFFALDQGNHWIGILRLSVSVLFFLILKHCISQNPVKLKKDFTKVIVGGAFLLSFFVILGMLLFEEHSVGSFFVQRGRIGGFFQYANSFAAYLFASQLLLLHQMEKEKNFRFIDLGIVLVIQIGIALTQSRALILINVCFLLLIGIWLLRVVLVSFLGLLIGQGMLAFFISNSHPERVLQLSASSSEWLSRILYYEDGLHMIATRPLGYGYLGYYYAQRYYQSGASYHVKFIHNGALQLALDFGLPFLLLLVYFIFRGLLQGIKEWQGKKILILGTIGFLGHCLVDINLQFLPCTLLAIGLLVMIGSHEQEEDLIPEQSSFSKRRQKQGFFLASIYLMLLVYFFGLSFLDRSTAWENEALPIEERVELAKKKVSQNPFFSEGYHFLRDYYRINGILEEAIFYSEKVIEYEPLWLEEYEVHIEILVEKLRSELLHQRKEEAEKTLEEIRNMDKYIKKLESERKKNYTIRHTVQFVLTDELLSLKNKAEKVYEEMK